MKKREEKKEGSNKGAPKSIDRNGRGEIKTERPFGEKDEVKRAEDKLRDAGKEKG